MKSKRFKLICWIEREEFIFGQNLKGFNKRMWFRATKIYLWEKSLLKVEYYKNKNFISKWLNNYYELKNLTQNYTYLDIDIIFYENPNLARILTKIIIESYKTEIK